MTKFNNTFGTPKQPLPSTHFRLVTCVSLYIHLNSNSVVQNIIKVIKMKMKHTLLPLNPKLSFSLTLSLPSSLCTCLFWLCGISTWPLHYSRSLFSIIFLFYLKSNGTIPLRTSTGGCFHFPKFSHVTEKKFPFFYSHSFY